MHNILNSSKATVIYESSESKSPPPPCDFCHRRDILGQDRYGAILRYKDINVHHFCLVFCHDLSKSSGDEEEFFGYSYQAIKEKIKNDLENGEPCIFCEIKGGTAMCAGRLKVMVGKLGKKTVCTSCEKRYHYSCGRDIGCHYSFSSGSRYPNKTFCHERENHFNAIEFPMTILKDECSICVVEGTRDEVLKTVCCPPDTPTEYHKCCIQMWANKKGTQFHCPVCRDKFTKGFCDQMQSNGVFLSDWEGDCFDEDDRENEEDVDMEALPSPILHCLAISPSDSNMISDYGNMRNTPYNKKMLQIAISTITPVPKTLWKVTGHGPGQSPYSGRKYKSGGTQVSEFPGGSRLVLEPNESRVGKRVRSGYEVIFLVEEGVLHLEYIRDNAIGRSRTVRKTLPDQTIATIKGVKYGLHNKSTIPTVVFIVCRKLAEESSRGPNNNSEDCRPVVVSQDTIKWFELYAHIKAGLTEKHGRHFFVKLEPECIYPLSMNTAGRLVVFVFKGDIKIRSTNTEEVQSLPSNSKKASKKSQLALKAEVMPEKTVFEIPLTCCFILENWEDVEAILFCVVVEDEVHGDEPLVQNSSE